MAGLKPVLIPTGTTSHAGDLIYYADPEHRTLSQALSEADLIVTGPHAAAAIPEELAPFLAPTLTERLQFDFTDVTTSPIARQWAAQDRRVVYVEDPHPRIARDANRATPADIEATLREAFARIRSAGAGQKVDLSGVDAIRPCTFAFLPVLVEPTNESGWAALMAAMKSATAHGVDVYERTRDAIFEQALALKLEAGRATGKPARLITLSLHDTMNHTARPDGAIADERPLADQLPAVVALSNRGDADGNPRGEQAVTLAPDLLRALAEAHREGFAVAHPEAVDLNRPYLGGYETTTAGVRLDQVASEALEAQLTLGAVQAEFCREFLLGPEATAEVMVPGIGWPATDPAQVAAIANALQATWDRFRTV